MRHVSTGKLSYHQIIPGKISHQGQDIMAWHVSSMLAEQLCATQQAYRQLQYACSTAATGTAGAEAVAKSARSCSKLAAAVEALPQCCFD